MPSLILSQNSGSPTTRSNLNGIECCKKLKVVYASNNKIKAWEGFFPLKELPKLTDLLLTGNPIEEKCSADGTWRDEVSKKLPSLKKLDGKPIIRDDDVGEDEGEGGEVPPPA